MRLPGTRAAGAAAGTAERRASPPVIGLVLDGKYRVLSQIGQGGMGTVYEAEDMNLRRRVAIKIPTHEPKRLLREGKLLAAVPHPNICHVYDLGRTPWQAPYVVLEKLNGETLFERLRGKRMTVKPIVELFGQILAGLDAAHGVSIVHRDLKPQNIFLCAVRGSKPVVKLLDFGFATELADTDESRLTQPGYACGTFQYMAPEQLTGAAIDHRADLFATGVILFELLTRRLPFFGANPFDYQDAVVHSEPARLATLRPDLPKALSDIVEHALRKRPEKRWQSAREFQAALKVALTIARPATRPAIRSTPLSKRAKNTDEEETAKRRGRKDVDDTTANTPISIPAADSDVETLVNARVPVVDEEETSTTAVGEALPRFISDSSNERRRSRSPKRGS